MRAEVIVFAIAALASVIAHVAILSAVVRRASAVADPLPNVPRPRLVAEILWALIPALVLALVLTATWARVQERATRPPDPLMKIAQ